MPNAQLGNVTFSMPTLLDFTLLSIRTVFHGPYTERRRQERMDKNALYGNRLDLLIRSNAGQTNGRNSRWPRYVFLLAEVIASSIDYHLETAVGNLKGTRYIDDYHLYFPSRANAEQTLAELHRIAGEFELEINGLKTQIEELPEPIDPHWKTQLRIVTIYNDDHATSLKAIFDRAAELARDFPRDSVFTYLVNKLETALDRVKLQQKEWETLDTLLLRAAVAEPGALPFILRIFELHERNPVGLKGGTRKHMSPSCQPSTVERSRVGIVDSKEIKHLTFRRSLERS